MGSLIGEDKNPHWGVIYFSISGVTQGRYYRGSVINILLYIEGFNQTYGNGYKWLTNLWI